MAIIIHTVRNQEHNTFSCTVSGLDDKIIYLEWKRPNVARLWGIISRI